MKKIFRNNRLIAIAFITMFSLATAPAALANGGKDVPAELKYVGYIKNHQIFQLSVAGNELNNEYVIFIRDGYGNQIYREIIKAESFTKNFLFDVEELSVAPLQFEVFSKKTKKSVVYTINSNVRQVEDIVIDKIE